MAILPKEYLSFADVANYFNSISNQINYDLSDPDDVKRLHSDIYDLLIEKKINVVFYYFGSLQETECDNKVDKTTGKLKNCINKIHYTSAYFSLDTVRARQMLIEGMTLSKQQSYHLYCYSDGEKRESNLDKIYIHEMLDDCFGDLTIQDLRIPTVEIMGLFDNTTHQNQSPNSKHHYKPIESQKGISLDKQQAKEAGRLLARLIWRNDTDKKIRMTEMCDLVCAELYNSRFYNQLPADTKSIKSWIVSEAPSYAHEGGAPTKE